MDNDKTQTNGIDLNYSPILSYYCGKKVFLTGVTGFLGECFVTKLLRIGVKTVYVLIRSRKKMTPQERLDKLLQSPIFEPLRKERPDFAHHIVLIDGTLDQLELNISIADQTTLFENIEIIVHSAADVRFDVPLAEAALRNIRGTRELLKLAKRMKKLENFIHISTAFAFCMRNVIGEDFYEPPLDSDVIIRITESLASESDLDILNAVGAKIIKPWPNTYTFSKAITEDLVRKYRKYFKITIVKPSIVTATFHEPIEGWASNYSGANGVFAGIVGGVLRCLKLEENVAIDMVYGDYVINGTLAAAYEVSTNKNVNPPIYNIISSNDYITTFDAMVKEILPHRKSAVPLIALWYPAFNFCHFGISYFFYNMALHVIPAVIFDTVLSLSGKKRRILKLYRQIHSFGDVINFFICSSFKFENNNMKRVCRNMTLGDKKKFPCDFGEVNWPEYRDTYVYKGIVATLLGDRSDKQTLKQNALKMGAVHYSFLTLCVCLFSYVFYVVLKKIFPI
ncbi:Fatty acyl-CoA reductase wat [Pseudolycoriella hygida]|uniref:Fatty acyl-CoA reductase n=1 Tax=Pseudolycoriella hygida TaxID=35572 RepID=A0A9Q0MRH7_9DIPT|nr:Fatty acyl-CoA reductase wat [Pseudolycoriella hygida]